MSRHRQNGSSFVPKKIFTCVLRKAGIGLKVTASKTVTTLLSFYPQRFCYLLFLSDRVLFPLTGYAKTISAHFRHCGHKPG